MIPLQEIKGDCGECGLASKVNASCKHSYDPFGNIVSTFRWDCPRCGCDNEVSVCSPILVKVEEGDFVPEPAIDKGIKVIFDPTMKPSSKRTNTVTAAAYSLGVDADLLEACLPALQGLTQTAKNLRTDGKSGITDVRIEFPQPIVTYGLEPEQGHTDGE